MKKNIFIIFILLINLNISCTDGPNDCELYERYSIKASVIGNDNYLINIRDNKKNSSFEWGKVQSCYSGHYHFAEYHSPNLYIIKRFDISIPDWKDELWLITKNNRKLISKAKGIDFRVNFNQTLIAFNGSNYRELVIKDLHNNSMKKIIAPNTDDGIELISWANSKDVLWGAYKIGASIDCFFKYDYSKNFVEQFKLPKGFVIDYSLNPDLGLLLYSDYPFIVDADTEESFEKSDAQVSLYLYDFYKQTIKVVSKAKAKGFAPKWICPNYFEFDSPDSKDTRVKIKYEK